MSKSFQLLSMSVVCSILFSSMAGAKTPLRKATVAQAENATATTTKTPHVAGTWKVLLSEEGRAATYIFAQKGNVLTGTMKGLPFGDMPISGTISNDGKLSFSGKMRSMKFSFAGTLTGQTMKGTADLPIGRKNWTATK
ncbi:hypothetical protein [Chamaesiphon sp.]|uniref:hypothetical protein n=1 Tax=Chamaesiphon sp. TaxID=2814140 RepID=UPI00359434A5